MYILVVYLKLKYKNASYIVMPQVDTIHAFMSPLMHTFLFAKVSTFFC